MNYTRDPSEDPEEDVDEYICWGHLSGRYGDVTGRGSANQLRSHALEEMRKREIEIRWIRGNSLSRTGMGGMNLINSRDEHLGTRTERG